MQICCYFLFTLSVLCLIRKANSVLSEKYFIKSLPRINTKQVQQYSGYLNVNDDIRIFFWLVLQSEPKNSTENLMIWLNGGPGCSSLEGMLLENGPFLADESGNLFENPYSWHQHANLLYVDQPVGTGFSYSQSNKKITTQLELGASFVELLQAFFVEFPDFEFSNLYVAGESFAGTYIPYIAKAILDRNEKVLKEKQWPLKGLMIGNGWIDPRNQYWSTIEYAKSKGLLSGSWLKQGEKAWKECLASLNLNGNLIRLPKCESVGEAIFEQSMDGGQHCLNMYDVRLRDPKPGKTCGINWPPYLKGVYAFLRNPEVLSAIHATTSSKAWVECSDSVYNAFVNDLSSASVSLRIVLYNGEHDLVCNYMGTEAMIHALRWEGQQGFTYAYPNPFFVREQALGRFQQERNLTYVFFANASHMVPIDQPEAMLQLLRLTLQVTPATAFLYPSPPMVRSSVYPVFHSYFYIGFAWGVFLTFILTLLYRYRALILSLTFCSRLFRLKNHQHRNDNDYLPVHALPKESPLYAPNGNTHLE